MRRMMVLIALATACTMAHAADPVAVQSKTPYSDDALIAGKIKRECTIDTQLPAFVAEYGKSLGEDIQLADSVTANAKGRVLVMKIIGARSQGNAFIGHHKSITISGKLYQDGTLVGSFDARRNSMGGAFAGFKGSCSVLGRDAKALGKDVAEWLVHPAKGSMLGDLN